MAGRRLGYRLEMLCVGHEIMPDGQSEEAEITVAGYSLCYPCGQIMLDKIMNTDVPVPSILRMLRDGVIEVSP